MAGVAARRQGRIVMRLIGAALAVFVCLAAPLAYAEGMADTFGNTVTATYPDGGVLTFYFEPDGTFTMIDRDGQPIAAAWAMDGDNICFTSSAGDRTCEPFPEGKKLGDHWAYVSADGVRLTLAVTPGRAASPAADR
jgi:hypothetical protein